MCTGYHTDTIASQCAEEFSGNTRCVLHVLAHNRHCRQSAFVLDRIHGALFDFLGKLDIEYAASLGGVHIAHTDAGAVLTAGLGNHEHTDAVVCQAAENTAVHTNHTHHTESADGYQAGTVNA